MQNHLDGFARSWKWAGLQAVGKVMREVQRSRKGAPMVWEHYCLCSFRSDVQRLAGLVREYWSVETRCDWGLDVTYGEDYCQVRDRRVAHNLCQLRELVIHMLRQHPAKPSLRRKHRRALFDPLFLLEPLNSVHS